MKESKISFTDAIASTQKSIEQIENKALSETEIQEAIAELVATQAGARGFFVAYLTGDSEIADSPTEGVINGLKSAPEVVSDLLVKNVAMSAGMELTHLRNNDTDAAAGSQRVNRRSINLIRKLDMPEIQSQIEELKSTIVKGQGIYQGFLSRWGYDQEQQAKIAEVISSI